MGVEDMLNKMTSNLWLIPEAKFDDKTKDVGYRDSFVYLLACLIIAIPISIIVGLVTFDDPTFSMGEIIVFITIDTILFTILIIPVLYIYYGVIHLIIKLLGGTASYLKSMQVAIYGSTLVLIISSIPLIGGIASLIALANVTLGMKKVHNLSLFKAILAVVVLPLVVAIVAGILLIGAMGIVLY